MKRASLSVFVAVLVALTFHGCGSKNVQVGTQSGSKAATTAASRSSSTGSEPVLTSTRGMSPEDVAKGFLGALANEERNADAYWDKASLDRLVVSTNQMQEVISLKTTGSGDRRRVTAEVYYLQCESGEKLKKTTEIDLENKDGEWRIVDYEPL